MEAISGLKVNLGKSKLFLVGDVHNVIELFSIIGWKVDSFPATYLGLSLGSKSSLKIIWNPVIERLEKRLSGWKERFLSK